LLHGKSLSGFSVALIPVAVKHRFTIQFNFLRIYALGLKCSSLTLYGKRHLDPRLALKEVASFYEVPAIYPEAMFI